VIQVINTGHTGTLQGDCSSVWYGVRVLTTDSVVPQRRCPDGGWNIRQADDEIVGSVTVFCKIKKILRYNGVLFAANDLIIILLNRPRIVVESGATPWQARSETRYASGLNASRIGIATWDVRSPNSLSEAEIVIVIVK